MSKVGVLRAVESSFLFGNVSPKTIQKVTASLPEEESFGRDETVYTYDRFRHCLGLVISGELRVMQSPDGRPLPMNCLKPGSLFGAAAVFSAEKRYVSHIAAAKPSKIVFISESLLEQFMQLDSRIARNYVAFLTGRIRFLNQRLAGVTGGVTDERVYQFLLSHRQEDGKIVFSDSLSNLAKELNMGRSSLYRCFEHLEQSGLLIRNGKEMRLSDSQQLAGL